VVDQQNNLAQQFANRDDLGFKAMAWFGKAIANTKSVLPSNETVPQRLATNAP